MLIRPEVRMGAYARTSHRGPEKHALKSGHTATTRETHAGLIVALPNRRHFKSTNRILVCLKLLWRIAHYTHTSHPWLVKQQQQGGNVLAVMTGQSFIELGQYWKTLTNTLQTIQTQKTNCGEGVGELGRNFVQSSR